MLKLFASFVVFFSLIVPVAKAKDWSKPDGSAFTKMSKEFKTNFDNFVFRREFKKNMILTERSVPIRGGLIEFSHDYFGEKGVKFNLSYSDIGDEMDWSRNGAEDFTQRFQLGELLKKTSKKVLKSGIEFKFIIRHFSQLTNTH